MSSEYDIYLRQHRNNVNRGYQWLRTKQISNNDHGYQKTHKYGEHGEHAHDYIYDDSGELIERTTRELSSKERKENDDIL